MQVYTYSEARQKLALVLEEAENTGKVLIRRKDGRTFALVPEKTVSSPLDVPTIKAKITTQEIARPSSCICSTFLYLLEQYPLFLAVC